MSQHTLTQQHTAATKQRGKSFGGLASPGAPRQRVLCRLPPCCRRRRRAARLRHTLLTRLHLISLLSESHSAPAAHRPPALAALCLQHRLDGPQPRRSCSSGSCRAETRGSRNMSTVSAGPAPRSHDRLAAPASEWREPIGGRCMHAAAPACKPCRLHLPLPAAACTCRRSPPPPPCSQPRCPSSPTTAGQ